MNPRFYQPSGGFNPVGVLIWLVIGLGICFGASFAYAYLSDWIPLIWLRFFFIIGLAFAAGFALGFLKTMAKVRHRGLMIVLGLLIGSATTYFQWVAHFHAQSSPGVWILNPAHLFEILQRMAEMGVWEIFDWQPTGWALYAFWIVEAGCIFVGTFLIGIGAMDDPFCEVTNEWADQHQIIQPLAVPENLQMFVSDVAQDPIAHLSDWPEPDDEDDPTFVRARLSYVENQEARCTWFLALYQVTLSFDDDGDVQESETNIMPHLIIDKATADALIAV